MADEQRTTVGNALTDEDDAQASTPGSTTEDATPPVGGADPGEMTPSPQSASTPSPPSSPPPQADHRAPAGRRASRIDDGAKGEGRGVAMTGQVLRQVRSILATAVFTVAVLTALVLALGAVLVALGANEQNAIVSSVLELGRQLQGPFADIFTFDDRGRQLLVNWGIGAVVFLIIGRVLERLIRP